jgi:hypothetical protein
MLPNMKNTFFYYIKLSLALVLLLQVGEVSAQSFVTWSNGSAVSTLSGTFTGGTVTITQSTTGTALFLNSPSGSTQVGLTQTGNNVLQTVNGAYDILPKDLIITFNTPVKITKLNVGGLDAPTTYNDQVQFTGVSFSGFTGSTFANVTSTGVQPFLGRTQQFGNFTNSNAAVSSFTIKSVPRDGLYSAVMGFEMEVVACRAGTTAPTLSATTATAACPANTVNLNSLVTGTAPTGATVKWYRDVAHTSEVTTPTAVGVSGTYYAFYNDATADCFSPASAAVTVTANCPLALATTCPAVSIDLSTRINTTASTGYTYTYHSGTPATASNKLTSSIVSTSGTYYIGTYFAAQDCYATTSRPMVVSITNCCAIILPPGVN